MFLIIIATVLIIGLISLVYRPMYSVSLDGEFIGYTANKSKLQARINQLETARKNELERQAESEKLIQENETENEVENNVSKNEVENLKNTDTNEISNTH